MEIKYLSREKDGDQYHYRAVFDEIPEITYEKIGNDYVGSCLDAFGKIIFSEHLKCDSYGGAFGNRELSLKMKDGSTEKIKSNWFDFGSFHKSIKFVNIGAGTPEKLKECYVYDSLNVNKEVFERLVSDYLRKKKVYEYYEIKKILFHNDEWFPVIVHGRLIPYMMNKNGDMVEMWTKEEVYAMHNVCKKVNGKWKEYTFFKFKYKDDTGRLIKLHAKYSQVLGDTIFKEEA